MRAKLKFAAVFGLGLVCFNLSFEEGMLTAPDKIDLNLGALQSSAVEIWCDPITSNPCVIYGPDGSYIRGVGQPKYQN